MAILLFVFLVTLAPSLQSILDIFLAYAHVPRGFQTVFVNLVTIVCLIYAIRTSFFRTAFRTIFSFKYWIPWLLYLMISGLLSDIGIWKFAQYFMRIAIPCVVVAALFVHDSKLFERIFLPTLLCVNIFFLFYLTFVLDVSVASGAEGIERNIWLARGIGINVFYFILNFKNSNHKFFVAITCILLMISMVLINSRGPVISLVVSVVFFLVIEFKFKPHILIVGGVFCFAVVLIIMNTSINNRIEAFMTHGKDMQVETAIEGRTGLYGPTFEIFKKNPIFGVGLGRWWNEYRKGYLHPFSWFATKFKREKRLDYTYPHNIIAEILSELGVVGMVFFLMTFLPLSRLTLSGPNSAYNYLTLLCFLFALTSSDIAQNPGIMMFSVLSYLKFREDTLYQENQDESI